MKTPDEIKKGLEICNSSIDCNDCPYLSNRFCITSCKCLRNGDALALIQQLEADKQQLEGLLTHMNQLRDAAASRALKMEERVTQLEAERDAAVNDLKNVCELCSVCCACKERFVGGERCRGCINSSHWEWRGIHKEE